MKILTGIYKDYDGEIELKRKKVKFDSPIDAQINGISMIHQELSLIDSLNVVDNIFLGRECVSNTRFIDKKIQKEQAKNILDSLGVNLDFNKPIGDYPVSIQQMIEIAKALTFNSDIVVMDEPTSALSKPEVEQLFKIIEEMKSEGKAIVYISHKMNEIYKLADTIAVLRDGNFIGKEVKENLPESKLISWIIGRELSQQFPHREPSVGRTVLKVENYSVSDPYGVKNKVVDSVSMSVSEGEIVGIMGLEGSGSHEFLLSLFGSYGKNKTGKITLCDNDYMPINPAHGIKNKIALLTNDRKSNGLVLGMSIENNISMASIKKISPNGWLNEAIERETSSKYQDEMNIKYSSSKQAVSELSGGNQQKVVLAKWIESMPKVLFLDDPTRGVDVGAKKEIYQLMNKWTARGLGIVLLSSELPEIMAMSDRFIVMHRGKVTAKFEKLEATQEKLLQAAMGKNFEGVLQ